MNLSSLRLLSILVVVSFAACGGTEEAAPVPDSGSDIRLDAGSEPTDAATPGLDASSAEDASVEPGPDAGSEADAGIEPGPDAGPASSCGDLGGSPCLSNQNCGDVQVCKSVELLGKTTQCCVIGSRGSKEEGAQCTTADECSFGRCENRDDGKKFCGGPCSGDLDCSGHMRCSAVFGWCYPRDAGAPPDTCGQVDLDQCFSNDACEEPERCENLGTVENEVLCCTPGARGTGAAGTSCTSELDCAYGRCFEGLCSDFCDDESPCPSNMVCNDFRLVCEPR